NFVQRNKSDHKQPNKENFLILRATPDDYDKILKLMRRAYYPEEPTTSSLAFKPTAVFEDSTIKILSEGYSLIAKCKYNDDILGACINETTHCWDPEMKDKLACKVGCVKSRQLLHFYAHMQRVPNLWKKYGVQKVFEIAHLFVRKDERGNGIAKKLVQHSRVLAADCGFALVRVDATSHYTAKLCEKINMKLIDEIPYCSYVGHDQRPVFNPPDPHKSVKIYVDDEPQKNAPIIS
ncbi:dopamine N-acetyltransferase, partial [Asbolus verrucosus]